MANDCKESHSRIIILMSLADRQRQLEYSSLVMGSKSVPSSAYPTTRPPHLLSTKVFAKKNQLLTSKYPKLKPNRIRTRNQRPDIFLEGEQLSHVHAAYHKDLDQRYLEPFKEKLRRSTPYRSRGEITKIATHGHDTNSHPDTPLCFSSFQEKQPDEATVKIVNTNTLKKSLSKYTQVSQPSQRQKTTGKEINRPKLKEMRIRIQHKLQLKKQQTQKLAREDTSPSPPRKQLFYINQKDLNGIRAQSFIVVQHPSNQIVTGYYSKKVVEIASLTKIMTFYTAIRIYLQMALNPDKQLVQIDAKVADITGTSAQLYEGDRYTVTQLFYALMLPSGNDAALALAKWGSCLLGEGERGFINYMNRLAAQIGMRNSVFANPHGLPHPQNGSTAEDVSILIGKCLEFAVFRDVISCKQFRCWTENQGVKREVVWENTNKLLRRPGFQGVKTGVTATAGPCLATLYNANGRRFIVVLLRTSKLSRRFKETRWILSMCLRKIGPLATLRQCMRQLSRNDAELDSDNSEDEQEFNFQRNDTGEFEKRRRILLNQL